MWGRVVEEMKLGYHGTVSLTPKIDLTFHLAVFTHTPGKKVPHALEYDTENHTEKQGNAENWKNKGN